MKINKYIVIASIFLVISIITFFTLRTSNNYVKTEAASNAKNAVNELSENQVKSLKTKIAQLKESDIISGEEDAKVTIIEYASYSCFHCGDFFKNIYPKIAEKYISTGKVRFIFRDFPLDTPSLKASQIVRCLPKDGKKNFMKILLESQKSWAFTKDFDKNLENLSRVAGLTTSKYNQCYNDAKLEEEILQERIDVFNAYKISSTPSFIINGKRYEGGNNWYNISEYIDNLLQEGNE
ncbi:MAG: DsbA family protein [Rickettsiales bacterium]|nr:DsbA family protein [Rickettsiales bacterium]